jgi:ABC-2 type transport system permease protein
MGRYFRTLRRFWGMALASEIEYRFNLLIELVAVVANLASSLFVLSLFFGDGHRLGGWSWPAALVVLGVHQLLDGLTITLLQPNLTRIVSHVQEGTLDFVLLKPIDSQFWLSCRTISPWGLPPMLAGLAVIGWAAQRAGAPADPATLAIAGLMLLSSAVILYSLWFLIAASSIWFVKIWNATEVLRTLLTAGRYPISAYPPGLRLLLTVVLPIAFLTSVPAEAILGRATASWLVASGALALMCLLISRWFWRFALRSYTSASS